MGAAQKTSAPVLHIRVPGKVYEFVNRCAAKEDRTKNSVVLRILLDAMGNAVRDGK